MIAGNDGSPVQVGAPGVLEEKTSDIFIDYSSLQASDARLIYVPKESSLSKEPPTNTIFWVDHNTFGHHDISRAPITDTVACSLITFACTIDESVEKSPPCAVETRRV